MFKKASIYCLSFIISLVCVAKAEVILFDNTETNNKIKTLAEERVYSNKTAGMVILVQKDGKTQYLNAFGYETLKDKGRIVRRPKKMSTDTVFDLASLTKVLATTQGIMMLVEQKKLKLDDKVSDYLPQFKVQDKKDITVYELLIHSSGLAPWRPLYMYTKDKKEVLDYIGKLPLAYKTNTNQLYSDLGFITLGAIIEKISGENLDTYLSNNLYKNLGMIDTGYNISEDKKARSASTSWNNLFEQNMIDEGKYGVVGNSKDFKKWRDYTLKGEADDGNAFYALGGVSGHAGLFSTASDISKLIQLMLNGGNYNGTTFYSKEIINQFSKEQKGQYLKGRAIGFDYSRNYMGKKRPTGTFGHIGFTGNCLAINKEKNIGIVILTNRENIGLNSKGGYTGFNDMCTDIMDTVYDNYKK